MVIILNARAGSVARKSGETRLKIAALFGALGAHPQIIVAEGKDVGAIARQAVAGNEETIVAGGGDGTVSTVAAEIAGTGITEFIRTLSPCARWNSISLNAGNCGRSSQRRFMSSSGFNCSIFASSRTEALCAARRG